MNALAPLAFLLGLSWLATAQAQQVSHPVNGPASSTANHVAVWGGTNGGSLKDGFNLPVLHTGPGPTPSAGNGYGGNLMFIGDAGQTPTSNWAETTWTNSVSNAKFAAISNTGGLGISGSSRTADSPIPDVDYSVGVAGFLLNNTTTASIFKMNGASVFGITKSTSTTAGALAAEFDAWVAPGAPSHQLQPYTWRTGLPSTMNLWLAAGDDVSGPSGDVSAAIGIINNQGKYKTGIMIASDALVGGTGLDFETTVRDAISLPRMGAITFWNSGSTTTPAARIYSTVDSAYLRTQDLVFADVGLALLDGTSGKPAFIVQSSSAAGTCFTQASQGVGITSITSAPNTGATNCTMYYDAAGTAGTHILRVNNSPVLTVSPTGFVVKTLPLTGPGGGKNPVCVDAVTGQFYVSTATTCS